MIEWQLVSPVTFSTNLTKHNFSVHVVLVSFIKYCVMKKAIGFIYAGI